MITCQQCRDDMAELALSSIDAARAEAMTAHLAACPVCRQEFDDLGAAWTALPQLLDPISPPAEVFDRVAARIDASPLAAAPAGLAPPRRGERILSWVLAASVLMGLTAGLWRLSRSPDDEADRRSATQLAERLGKLQHMERLLASRNVRLVSVRPESAAGAIEASVVWDLAARQWHVYVANLPAAPPGRQYQLWAADRAGVVHAGPLLTPNDQGLASALADLPNLDVSGPAKALITLEPTGGSKQPTGKVILEAAL